MSREPSILSGNGCCTHTDPGIDLAHELDELRQQQTLLLTLLDHTHAGVVVHDAAGSIRYMNSSARNIFGLTLANMADAQIQQGQFGGCLMRTGTPVTADQPRRTGYRNTAPHRRSANGYPAV